MSTIRRVAALMLTALVMTAAMAAVPAGADDPETIVTTTAPEAYVASALARALDISLFGNHVTVGSSNALIDSTPKAKAEGAGVALVAQSVASASVVGADQGQDPPQACAVDLPVLGLLRLAVACGDAVVTTAGGLPQAAGQSSIATLDLGLTLLNDLLDPLLELVGNTIGEVLDQVVGILGGLLDPLIGNLGLSTDSLVDDLIDGLQRATSILTVEVGPSSSTATTDAAMVKSEGMAEGAVIKVLPGLGAVGGAPLLTIVVGSANARVEVTRPAPSQDNRVTAVATPSFDAALVRVILGLPLLGDVTEIPVAFGSPITLLANTPLESTISVGAGSTSDGPNGTKIAVADGVSLQLLKGLQGGIGIALAHAEAVGGGFSAVFSVQEKVKPKIVEPKPELVRTGGDPWVPMVGAGLLLAAFLTRRMVAGRP